MQAVAGLSVKERAEIFTETAANRNMTPSIVDKDFWVTWVLKCLFEHSYLSTLLTFKGGVEINQCSVRNPVPNNVRHRMSCVHVQELIAC